VKESQNVVVRNRKMACIVLSHVSVLTENHDEDVNTTDNRTMVTIVRVMMKVTMNNSDTEMMQRNNTLDALCKNIYSLSLLCIGKNKHAKCK
jgi:flagellar biosynthesis regulator FlbT